jgi:sulfopyruvate decarboxylase subunit beta
MKRYDCLRALAAEVKDALVVSSAGAMTLEWNSLHPSDGNFRVRTLGLCSSIALGMALGLPHRKVVALDGDGSLLMNLCSLPTIARMRPGNLVHMVFDNEVYEASGSKQTATGAGTDLVGIARAAGIKNAQWARTVDEFAMSAAAALRGNELCFIGAKVSTERIAVPPFPIDEVENKYRFIRYIEKSEKIEIFKTNLPASYV